MEIIQFDQRNEAYIKAGAELLRENFPESYREDPMKEMMEILSKQRIALMGGKRVS